MSNTFFCFFVSFGGVGGKILSTSVPSLLALLTTSLLTSKLRGEGGACFLLLGVPLLARGCLARERPVFVICLDLET